MRSLLSSLAAATVLAALAPSQAQACGGFFCFTQPIDQSKERIVFAIDEEKAEVEVHVQIFYQGDARKFSWVVPVPTVPEVLLSTDALFAQLEWQTQPSFWLQYEERGTCSYNNGGGWYGPSPESDGATGGAPTDDNAVDEGVEVFKQGKTGPYDWAVVGADDAESLLRWLADPDGNPATDDGYSIPEAIASKLGPYLADGAKFVAFKLQSDATAGDIAPIRLQFQSTEASIPLVLTSIAATPDMRLQPYVFSSKRAVPENYLHVRINEAAINWLQGGNNYDAVVTQAANEAGGQAFATDFFGSTEPFRNQLYQEGRFDLAALRGTTNPEQFLMALINQGFPRDATMQDILRDFMPLPEAAVTAGISDVDFYNCMGCYPEYVALLDFDPEACVDALEERVVEPLIAAEALFHTHGSLTRLTSSMSPDEMTSDPTFVLNADMAEPVSNAHTATLVIDCGDGLEFIEAPRWIQLTDGRVVEVPPESWFQEDFNRYTSWIDDADQPAAEVIEQTGATGQPQPISNTRPEADARLETYNDWVRGLTGREGDGSEVLAAAGCGGCASQGQPVGLIAGLLGGLGALVRRRRR